MVKDLFGDDWLRTVDSNGNYILEHEPTGNTYVFDSSGALAASSVGVGGNQPITDFTGSNLSRNSSGVLNATDTDTNTEKTTDEIRQAVEGDVEVTDLLGNTGTNGQILKTDGSALSFADDNTYSPPPSGIVQYTSNATGYDINTSGFTAVPWDTVVTPNSSYDQPTNEEIEFTNAGTYWVNTRLMFSGTVDRANPATFMFLNGNQLEGGGQSGYIRNNSGHNDGSSGFARYVEVNANDTLTIRTTERGNSGTITLNGGESILSIEQRE
jgi:hypothetical protein